MKFFKNSEKIPLLNYATNTSILPSPIQQVSDDILHKINSFLIFEDLSIFAQCNKKMKTIIEQTTLSVDVVLQQEIVRVQDTYVKVREFLKQKKASNQRLETIENDIKQLEMTYETISDFSTDACFKYFPASCGVTNCISTSLALGFCLPSSWNIFPVIFLALYGGFIIGGVSAGLIFIGLEFLNHKKIPLKDKMETLRQEKAKIQNTRPTAPPTIFMRKNNELLPDNFYILENINLIPHHR